MKTIGLIGGMSWQSTLLYYHWINEDVQAALGGLHSARILLDSLDFAPLARAQAKGDWNSAARILAESARRLETAGADFLLVCANTMHRVADDVQASVRIPLVHIADTVAEAALAFGVANVGLLGTRATLEHDFYARKLESFGLKTTVPEADDRAALDRIIFEELCRGIVREESRAAVLAAVETLLGRGADGIALACTELGLLLDPEQTDIGVPLLDSARLHARKAARLALDDALLNVVEGIIDDRSDAAPPYKI